MGNYKSNHTPGNWKKGLSSSEVISDQPPGDDRFQVCTPRSIENYGGYLIAESVNPENQALIAAAPDLLQAAINFLFDYEEDNTEEEMPLITEFKLAVNKALGIYE